MDEKEIELKDVKEKVDKLEKEFVQIIKNQKMILEAFNRMYEDQRRRERKL